MATPITMFDTNIPVTSKLPQLKAAGITKIIRYINPLNLGAEKTVKQAEARAFASVGMKLGLVCEGWGGASKDGIGATINDSTGTRDARVCLGYLPVIGAPNGTCVYYAIDVDASVSEVDRYVIPYFKAIHAYYANNNPMMLIGVYGPGACCQALLDAELVDLTWLANAMGWRGSREFYATDNWNIIQQRQQIYMGLDIDPDVVNPRYNKDGCFIPYLGAMPIDVPAPAHPPSPTQEPPVSTQPTPVPTLPMGQFDLAKIDAALDTAEGFLTSPLLSPWIPVQVKAFLPLIPIIKEVIEAIQQWQSGAHNAEAAVGIISELMTDIARELKSIKTGLANPG